MSVFKIKVLFANDSSFDKLRLEGKLVSGAELNSRQVEISRPSRNESEKMECQAGELRLVDIQIRSRNTMA